MIGTIISAYTRGNGYAEEAARLSATLEALGLAYLIGSYTSRGSWLANCAYKAEYIAAMRARLSGPLLWLDADARVESDPWPHLSGLGVDAAFHRLNGRELLSGTLYFADTPGAASLLTAWERSCRARPDEWDQKVLDRVLSLADDATSAELPPELCWIDAGGGTPDISERAYGPRRPVVRHTQASRRLRHTA